MSGLLDFTLPGSDPNQPNTFVQTPDQIARARALAAELAKGGSDYSPIRSAWQGAARLAQAISGAVLNGRADDAQRLGTANAAAEFSNALGGDPGQANIGATPGQTTPALRESDAKVDAESAAEDAALGNGGQPNPALAAALGGGAAPSAAPGNSMLASAISGAPQGGANDFYHAAAMHESGMRNIPNAAGGAAGGYYQFMPQTWQGIAQQHPELNLPPNPMQASFEQQTAAYHALTQGNVGALSSAGIPINDKNVFMGSFLGGGGATKFLSAMQQNPNVPAAQLFPAEARSNPTIFYGPNGPKTLGQIYAGMTSAFGGGNTTGFGGLPATASAGAPPGAPLQLSSAAGALPGGPQGAGAAMTPAPSQADLGQLRTAMQPTPGQGGFGLMSSANAAEAPPNPALAQAAGLSAPIPAASPNVPMPPPRPPGLGMPAPAAPVQTASAAPVAPPAPAPAAAGAAPMQPGAAASGFHPNVQALLNVLSDPWASPAQQQIAQAMLSAQMPSPPTFGVIGKDPVTGNEQYGWISPKTMTVTPANGGAAPGAGAALPAPATPAAPQPAPGAGGAAPEAGATPAAPSTVSGAVNLAEANGMTPQGATYLNGMEAQGGSSAVVARQARAIIDGQAPLPEANAATKPIDIAIRDAVLRAAPGFNSSLASARVDLVKSFGDKTSPTSAGGMIVSANAALHHLNALADSADRLGNTSYPAANWIKNEGTAAAVGNPALKAYDFNKNALADEIAKIYKGGTPAEGEIRAMVSTLSPNMTPDEQKAVFSKVSTLLQGKTDELQRQWQTAFGAKSTYPVIGDEGQAVIKRFSGGLPASSAAAAPASAPRAAPPVGTVSKGHRFIGGDPSKASSWEPLI